jgi:ribosomal-protein-alanine acetyltransferase
VAQNETIRPFRSADGEAVARILRESPGAAPWLPGSGHETTSPSAEVILVSELDSGITGFVAGRWAADEAEILNLAVRPEARRAAHGSALLSAALQGFRDRKVSRVFLEVRESNAAAVAFYGKHGFVPVGRRKGYYRDPREDAVVMEKKLT